MCSEALERISLGRGLSSMQKSLPIILSKESCDPTMLVLQCASVDLGWVSCEHYFCVLQPDRRSSAGGACMLLGRRARLHWECTVHSSRKRLQHVKDMLIVSCAAVSGYLQLIICPTRWQQRTSKPRCFRTDLLADSIVQLIWRHAMRNQVSEDLVAGLGGDTFNPACPHTAPWRLLKGMSIHHTKDFLAGVQEGQT